MDTTTIPKATLIDRGPIVTAEPRWWRPPERAEPQSSAVGHGQDHVHFIAVNYRSADAFRRFADSLTAQGAGNWRLTVADNSVDAAETGRLRAVAETDERIDVWPMVGNIGYFGAAEHVRTRYPDRPLWTVVSNVDIRLDPSFVTTILRAKADTPVIAPAITAMPSGRPQNPYMRSRPSTRAMLARRLAFSTRLSTAAYTVAGLAKARLRARPEESRPVPLYAPHGAIIAFHRAYFAAGGSLYHPIWLFAEELTVAEQCRRRGLAVRYEPALRVLHDEHQSTGRLLRARPIWQAQRDAARYGYRLISDSRGRSRAAAGVATRRG